MHPYKYMLHSALLLSLALAGAAFGGADPLPQVGQPAPDFSLPSQDGSQIALHDFKGKWVVLYFYPKDGSYACTIEAHNFQRDLPKYEGKHAVIVGVSVDSANSHQEFCAKQGLTYKLLADSNKTVSRRYGSLMNLLGLKLSARNTFLVNPEGKIVKVWTGVDAGKHSVEVLTALTALQK
jgi:thioredoxin-dependent peroxiredoxin